MAWKFVPEIVNNGFYEGYVLVDFPGYKERNEIKKSIYFSVDAKTGVVANDKAFDISDKLQSLAMDRIKEVKLKRVSDSLEIKSIDEMDANPETCSILEEVSALILNGVKLSKN
jgi:hypothetical protein